MSRIGRLYIAESDLRAKIDELGRAIAGSAPDDLLLVTKLKGGVPFLADLVRRLGPHVTVDFLALTAYTDGERHPGMARIIKDLDSAITGRHVLIVDDVLDTGLSMSVIVRNLYEREPASLGVCALLDRVDKRIVDVPVVYRGFELGEQYLVGYGLDFLGLYRNLPCLVVIDDLDGLHASPHALVPDLRTMGIW